MNSKRIQTLSLAVGAAFIGSLALSTAATASRPLVTTVTRCPRFSSSDTASF